MGQGLSTGGPGLESDSIPWYDQRNDNIPVSLSQTRPVAIAGLHFVLFVWAPPGVAGELLFPQGSFLAELRVPRWSWGLLSA